MNNTFYDNRSRKSQKTNIFENPVINKSLMLKDTMINVFPSYGIIKDQLQRTENRDQLVYNDYNQLEQRKTVDLNRDHFYKWDDFKKYTEELLKTKNMRGRK